jgi:hypothetical protein
VADMQAVCGAVIADVSCYASVPEALIERLEVGALMHKAAFDRGAKKGGARCRHGYVI